METTNQLFWQYLLAAELPVAKSRAIVESLGTSCSDPVSSLLSSRLLSSSERERMMRTDPKKIEAAFAKGATAVTSGGYNLELLSTETPPPALFAWGETDCLSQPMVAIVGTRGATTYGKAVAQKFAEAFARAGLVVASGGAMGIDTCAHEGALAVGGRTVAVLANGVDVAQPPKNGPLFERIRESGCLVSPYAIGCPAMEHRFGPRNQLIAALSLCVVVVEAPAGSGSLMTCTAAADLGREVFVVPGTIDMPGFRGSHNLIRDGATLVDDPSQVLSAIGYRPAGEKAKGGDLSDLQASILSALTATPAPLESVLGRVEATSAEVLTELTMLEIEGYVIKSAMGYCIKP